VRGDAVHLQQVLLNLVFNAMDAMADIPPRARHVTLGTWRNGTEIEVFVSDRGHGIDHDKLERIFESFYSTKGDGMGLGLAIARSIVHAHGGKIWAQNHADGGATVRVTLPLAARG
jgi:signal transduction histidine kinase